VTVVPFLARLERFASVGSTNDVVRAWLEAGTPEVCLAVADEQTAGRGRDGRTWTAPPGAGLLLSVGFRPTWLEPDRSWRLASIVALAMADAAEAVTGLRERSIRLKWPNDLVIEQGEAEVGAGTRAGQLGTGGRSAAPLAGAAAPLAGAEAAAPLAGAGAAAPLATSRSPLPVAQPIGHTGGSEGRSEPGWPRFVAEPAANGAHGPMSGRRVGHRLHHGQQRPPPTAPATAPATVAATAHAPATDPAPAEVRKLAGILGETVGLGTADPRVIIGIGVNADWLAADFPPDLRATMTSLREASGGQAIDREDLLDAFITRLELRAVALRGGRFDVADWVARQLTDGRPVRLDTPDGRSSVVRALGVDVDSGGLIVADPGAPSGERTILTGEIVHLRLTDDPGPLDSRPVGV
jgi:biotin-(acetyl-CoA carboxylase) ligase